MMDKLNELIQTSNSDNLIKGKWFNIRWVPDLATGEKLNIGVVFKTQERIYFQVLSYFERIKCLYGEQGVHQASLVASIVVESLRLNSANPPIEQIIYEGGGYAQGSSIDEVVSSLFNQTVPLQKKIRETASTERFNSITVDKLYDCIVDELKTKAALDFNRIVPPNSSIELQSDNQKLYVPFRDGRQLIGGLASTVYSNVQTIELNLLKAARDVESALKLGKGTKPAVFILKPGSELSKLKKEQVISIENTLDRFDWHMTKHGLVVRSHTEIHGLADEVLDWAGIAA